LFDYRPSEKRVDEIAAMLPAAPAGFGPTYRDRKAWDQALKGQQRERIIQNAEKIASTPMPAWDDDAYLEFSRKGVRPRGEKMMAARSERLATLALAECLENKGHFNQALEADLLSICRQPSWTLAAHDWKLTNFRRERYEVDLNVATLGQSIAQLVYMLDDKLSPAVRAEVLGTFRERVFSPVAESLRTGQYHDWLMVTSNWNAVCLSGVTGSAFSLLPDRRERAFFAAVAESYSRRFISGFNADGYCTEGLGYFNYGFGYFIVLRENLLQATGGGIDLFADPKIRLIARFPKECEMNTEVWPAIADCRFGTTPSPDILLYLNRVLGLGAASYDKPENPVGRNLAGTCMQLFANSASTTETQPGQGGAARLRSYYDATGLLVCRPHTKGGLAVALKGGHNDEHHNHNDIGSFSIAVGHQLLMGDAGGPHAYTSETFGPRRYELYKSLASFGHPVPLVAGVEQRPGRDAAAKIVEAAFSDAEDRFSLDLKSAYPAPALRTLVRHFTYQRAGRGALVVRDEFAFSTPSSFEIAFCTHHGWKRLGPRLFEFSNEGRRLRAEILAPEGGFVVTTAQISDNAPEYTRIGVRITEPLLKGEMIVRFSDPEGLEQP
jgi:hypothetical protein